KALQQKNNMAILLITHDLGVVAKMADEVAVMYAGVFIEWAPDELFFKEVKHPYTQKLMAALPEITARDKALSIIEGKVPRLDQNFTECRFLSRCDKAF